MQKKLTLEELASLIQRTMASKEDLKALATKEDLRQNEERLVRRIEGLELKISSYASAWNRDFDRLHEWV